MKHSSLLRLLIAITLGVAIFPLAALADDSLPYLINPIRCNDFLCLFLQIIRFLLAGVAVLSTGMFVYGGYLFLASGGNPDQIKKGKETLLWASLGIVVILGSWILIQFIINGFVKSSGAI